MCWSNKNTSHKGFKRSIFGANAREEETKFAQNWQFTFEPEITQCLEYLAINFTFILGTMKIWKLFNHFADANWKGGNKEIFIWRYRTRQMWCENKFCQLLRHQIIQMKHFSQTRVHTFVNGAECMLSGENTPGTCNWCAVSGFCQFQLVCCFKMLSVPTGVLFQDAVSSNWCAVSGFCQFQFMRISLIVHRQNILFCWVFLHSMNQQVVSFSIWKWKCVLRAKWLTKHCSVIPVTNEVSPKISSSFVLISVKVGLCFESHSQHFSITLYLQKFEVNPNAVLIAKPTKICSWHSTPLTRHLLQAIVACTDDFLLSDEWPEQGWAHHCMETAKV